MSWPLESHPFSRRSVALSATVLVVLTSSTPVWARGRLGHRVTARLAGLHLTPRAKAGIQALLADGESLADCSTWADEYRRHARASGPGTTSMCR